MLINVILALLIGFVVWVLFTACNLPYFMSKDIDNPFAETKYFTICTIIIAIAFFIGGIFANYYIKTVDIEQLKVKSECNLNNVLTIANNINEKVIVKTDNDKVIIDVANLSQSTLTSQVYIDYVKQVNEFNSTLAEYKAKGKNTVITILLYGIYPELPVDLKYIKIKL